MIDYQYGKIYKIVGNGTVYVGSTTRPLLCQRLAKHRSNYNEYKKGKRQEYYVTSFECLSDPECYIELLEAYPCNSKNELQKCERKWIESIECINKVIPTRTHKEYLITYNEVNKEKLKKYKQEWHQKNKERMNERARLNTRAYRVRKKLLASNNSLPIDPTNLSVEVQPQEATLIIEHEEE